MKQVNSPWLYNAAVVLLLAAAAAGTPAAAQNFGGAFEGMRNSGQQIQIEADRLEVVDQDGTATFEGNVNVVRGVTVLKTRTLKVFYERNQASEGDTSGGNIGAAGGDVRRIEASGKVAVQSGDQTATADAAVVDLASQVATMTGNVLVSQGPNVAKGCLLRVNLETNAATLEPCKSGRVILLLSPPPNRKKSEINANSPDG